MCARPEQLDTMLPIFEANSVHSCLIPQLRNALRLVHNRRLLGRIKRAVYGTGACTDSII
jgi:hypothetical protein